MKRELLVLVHVKVRNEMTVLPAERGEGIKQLVTAQPLMFTSLHGREHEPLVHE